MSSMIKHCYTIESDCYIPYHNQAIEEYLLNHVDEESIILYLWQNKQTVVIGKNQNAYGECDVTNLEGSGGYLARRISGGGAVYHDLGNMCFTFLVSNENYDVAKQTEVILRAVQKLGVEAYRSGRNDLLIDERKFSGHAYYRGKKNSFHHGTIMVDVNQNALSRYLNVSPLKLKDKSVPSVRSRVINLRECLPELTLDELKVALYEAFEEVYELKIEEKELVDFESNEYDELENKFTSKEWRLGRFEKFDYSAEEKFDWGLLNLQYNLENDTISDLVAYSDCLVPENIEDFPKKVISHKLSELNEIKDLNEQEKDALALLERNTR